MPVGYLLFLQEHIKGIIIILLVQSTSSNHDWRVTRSFSLNPLIPIGMSSRTCCVPLPSSSLVSIGTGRAVVIDKILCQTYKVKRRPAPVYHGVVIVADYVPPVQRSDSGRQFLVCPSPPLAARFPASP
jgi:hypothetical protein